MLPKLLHPSVDMEALAEGHKLQLTEEEVEALEVLYRRAYSAALLANAAADAAGPLMYSDHLRVSGAPCDLGSCWRVGLAGKSGVADATTSMDMANAMTGMEACPLAGMAQCNIHPSRHHMQPADMQAK